MCLPRLEFYIESFQIQVIIFPGNHLLLLSRVLIGAIRSEGFLINVALSIFNDGDFRCFHIMLAILHKMVYM